LVAKIFSRDSTARALSQVSIVIVHSGMRTRAVAESPHRGSSQQNGPCHPNGCRHHALLASPRRRCCRITAKTLNIMDFTLYQVRGIGTRLRTLRCEFTLKGRVACHDVPQCAFINKNHPAATERDALQRLPILQVLIDHLPRQPLSTRKCRQLSMGALGSASLVTSFWWQ